MAGLGGFAGFVAGDPVGAFQRGRKNEQGIEQGNVDAQAQAAAGNAYMGMFGQQQTPGAMPGGGPPGQPQPGAPQAQQPNMLQMLIQKLQGLGGGGTQPQPPQQMMQPPGPGGGQPGPGGPPPGLPQQTAVPGARPLIPAGGSSVAPAPPMGGQQGGGMPPQQPMGGQPQQGMGQGQLTWQSIVQQVVRANPGVKDPRVIAAAVDKFVPIMNSQSLMEWRQQQANLRGFNAETGRERADTSREQGGERLDIARGESTRKAEQGDKRLQQGDRRLDQGDKREERLSRDSIVRQDAQLQTIKLRREALERQVIQGNNRQMLAEYNAAISAEHKRVTEIINSAGGNMSAAERKKLIDEENAFYKEQTEKYKAARDGAGDKPQGSITGKPGESIVGGGTTGGDTLKPGTVEKGFRFKGGDRYDKKNWEPVSDAGSKTKMAEMSAAEQKRMQRRIDNAEGDADLMKIRRDLQKMGIDPDSIPQLQFGKLAG